MPILSNVRWEQFALGISNGMTQIDAYEHAGYPRNASAASQLKNKPAVQARIQELLSDRSDQARREGEADLDDLPDELNREWLIKTLMKNVAIAQKAQQIAPANKAVEMLAEIIGFSIKKRRDLSATPGADEEEPTDEQSFDFDKANDAIGRMMEALPTSKADPTDE